MTDDPQLISIRAFAKLVGVSHTAINDAIKRGRITAVDPTTKKLFRTEALEEWELSHRTSASYDPDSGADEELLEEIEAEAPDEESSAEKQNWGIRYTKESALLKFEQRMKVRLERLELERKMHRAEDVDAAWSDIISSARSKLLALPADVAGAIGIKLKRDRITVQQIIECEVEKILLELASDVDGKIAEYRSRRIGSKS